ncbi:MULTISPECIES: DUF3025 domain-containing protein [Deefgea]|uniref:DUF3025 domain-containing protein n=1 Tax=Deefgea chitinilytica TaxID=570276 RepID=A0ABS2CB97_9NEIS|nr:MULTISPECIES: DUF3025 domain-containing protein [Deefgea]MBM5571426.1 DUF3025 domain-containing protein [Deefgea chitinilytica]MBM9888659.1 DUF3025 domain-containing protein [Deefgea sp. CFH1-16]
MISWPLDFFRNTPAFAPILPFLSRFSRPPSHADWLTVSEHIVTEGGATVRFVDPDSITQYYELEIYQLGNVATRLNWHDTFNAMVWQSYPKTKVALNALHYHAMQHSPNTTRGALRDAATLFDECGFILPYSNPALLELMIQHEWYELFVTQAQSWGREINALVFGHATFENLLAPFIGLTGKCWPVLVDSAFFNLDFPAQRQHLDHVIAEQIHQGWLQRPRQLPPLPYLGIPQWWPQQDEAFYRNQAYFRPRRTTG